MIFCRYFLCFVLFGFIGWAYESAYYTLQQRRPVNSGFLSGICCPIYGIGGLLILMLLGHIRSTIMLFFAGMLLTCTLEYIVSWILEVIFHRRWWDYTNWPLNINGRVCIIGGVAFGLLGVLLVRVIAPVTFGIIDSMPRVMVDISAFIAAALIIVDLIVTIHNSENFNDKLWYVREQAGIFDETGIGGRLVAKVNKRISHPIKTIEKFFRK